MVIPVHLGDRDCTSVIRRRTPVKYWSLAGAVRKGVLSKIKKTCRNSSAYIIGKAESHSTRTSGKIENFRPCPLCLRVINLANMFVRAKVLMRKINTRSIFHSFNSVPRPLTARHLKSMAKKPLKLTC